jgi:reactive intermediate/imine deaminase
VSQSIEATNSPAPSGSYSQARISNGLLFLAGVGPYDPATREIVGSTVEEQTVRVVENIRAVLLAANCDLGDVVNSTVFLADLGRDWAAFDATYGSFFQPPYPARTAVGATLKNMLVEIAVVAALPERRGAGIDPA